MNSNKIKSSFRAFAATLAQSICFLTVFAIGLAATAALVPVTGKSAVTPNDLILWCAGLSIALVIAVYATAALGWRRVQFETLAYPVKTEKTDYRLWIIPADLNPRLSERLALTVGCHIFLHEAYLRPERVAEFSAVLGHEAAHVVLKHSQKKIWHSLGVGIGSLVIFLMITLALSFTNPSPELSAGIALGIAFWSMLRVSRFSRLLEHEADEFSVKHLGVAIQDVEKSLVATQASFFAPLRSHPSRQARLQALSRVTETGSAPYNDGSFSISGSSSVPDSMVG